MNTSQSSLYTRLKVGVFTITGLFSVGMITFLVNNRPFWWKPCQLVNINVEDATGLKMKSPVRSLGIEIGYLRSVVLTESHVSLGICITSPVEILPDTRAYIRGEGFLGDKFVELKPVRYLHQSSLKPARSFSSLFFGSEAYAADTSALITPVTTENVKSVTNSPGTSLAPTGQQLPPSVGEGSLNPALNLVSDKNAAPAPVKTLPSLPENHSSKSHPKGKEIPMGKETQDIGQVVNRMNDLMSEISGVASNLKKAVDPEDMKRTMQQLNRTLENASRTLSPEGGLNQTAQRTLSKLEDASEQFRDLLTRINKGEGSLGMLLNDPSYAAEVHLALKNVNVLLNKFSDFKFKVDIGGAQVTGYNGGRGWFQVGIWPRRDRYYLIGIAMDPRGRISNLTTTTTAGGFTQVTQTHTVDQTGMLLTGMIGKVLWNRVDVSIGALYGDGAASVAFWLGPEGSEDRLQIRSDVYFRNSASPLDNRLYVKYQAISSFYVTAGIESFHRYAMNDQRIFFFGGGLRFDDEDVKLLFALK